MTSAQGVVDRQHRGDFLFTTCVLKPFCLVAGGGGGDGVGGGDGGEVNLRRQNIAYIHR